MKQNLEMNTQTSDIFPEIQKKHQILLSSSCIQYAIIQIPNKNDIPSFHPLLSRLFTPPGKDRWRNFPTSLGLSWPLTTNPPNLGGGNRHLRTHYGVPSSKLNIAGWKIHHLKRCISYWKGWISMASHGEFTGGFLLPKKHLSLHHHQIGRFLSFQIPGSSVGIPAGLSPERKPSQGGIKP